MHSLAVKWRWALKLLRAKNFVVVTDNESSIYVKGVDPRNFDESLSVTGQRRALEEFRRALQALIIQHDERLEQILNEDEKGNKHAKPKRTATAVAANKPQATGTQDVEEH